VKKALDELFYKGVVIPRGDFHKREEYKFVRTLTHLHDAALATEELDVKKDKPFFKMWDELMMKEAYPRIADQFAGMKERGAKPFSRIIPAYLSIKDLPGFCHRRISGNPEGPGENRDRAVLVQAVQRCGG